MKVQVINKIGKVAKKQVQLLLPFSKKKPKEVQMTFRFPKVKECGKKLDKRA